MMIYELKEFSGELSKKPKTADELIDIALLKDCDPRTIETYATKADALKALENYTSTCKFVRTFAGHVYAFNVYAVDIYEQEEIDGEIYISDGADYECAKVEM